MSLADHGHCLGNRGQWKGLEVLPFSSLGLWTPLLPLGRSGVSRWSVPESILFFFSIVTKAVVVVFVFFFGYAGSLLSSSFLHGLSLVTVNRGASLVAAQGLLTAVASFVAEHRLSCLMACGILVLGPGIELTSPALAAALPTTGPPERSPQSQFQALRESGWQRWSSCESKRWWALSKQFRKENPPRPSGCNPTPVGM